ncbi:YdcH family protein [Alloyangia pacifica]|uniref:YdcH family protein n=1 Tax=Alloyangia pacifica TaxID=311180 RepID=UPI0031D3973F
MSHVPHSLAEEFPQFAARISELKQQAGHFATLAERYYEVNREVHGAESGLTPMEGLAEADLRKKRAALKDEIYALLSADAEGIEG